MSVIPVVLVDRPDVIRRCTAVVLTTAETWFVPDLRTPTTQKVVVVGEQPGSHVLVNSLTGRRALYTSCNSSEFFVKSEFESDIRPVQSTQLQQSFSGSKVMKNRTVLLGTFNCSIFAATGPIHNGKPEWIDGVELLGVTAVLNSHGLNWSIVPTNGYGKVHPDGSMEEGKLNHLLAHGQIDFGFCSFWQASGVNPSDVMNPWHRTCTRLLVPRPKQVNPHWYSVFKPLPFQFWMLALLFSFISACVMNAITCIVSPSQRTVKGKRLCHASFADSCFEAISLLTQGVSNILKLRRKARTIQVSWSIYAVIAAAAYSSSLASTLTTPVEEEAPQTLVELIQNDFVWTSGLCPLSNPEVVFQTQSGVDEQWLKLRVTDVNTRKGKTTILGQELAGLFILTEVDSFAPEFLASLMVSKECLAAYYISIRVRKMSPYFEFMSEGFTRLAETGVLTKMLFDSIRSPRMNKYIIQSVTVQPEPRRGGTPLGIAPLRGAFYLLAGGQLAAIIIFIFEVWICDSNKIRQKRKKISIPNTPNPDAINNDFWLRY